MKSQDDSCFYPLFLGRPHFIASFLQLIQGATVLDNCSAETNSDKDRYGLHPKITSTSTREQGVSQAWLRDKQVPQITQQTMMLGDVDNQWPFINKTIFVFMDGLCFVY